MDKNIMKKNLLLKKNYGNVDMNGNCNSEIKENKTDDVEQIYRLLAVEGERVLVIDCIKKTMPVWVAIEKLDGFVEEQEANQPEANNFDALEDYSPDVRKIIYTAHR